MTRRPSARADGFALVTAVLAMALLSLVALGILQLSRGHAAGVAAEVTRARLRAAADAGFFYAIRQLSLTERERRWSIDGRPHPLRFNDVDLAVAVEDERGKIPLNSVDDDEARATFAEMGVGGAALDALTDAFLDWRDEDNQPRPHGAEADYYRPLGRLPRNGHLRSLAELLGIRGMTPALLERLKPVATVFGEEEAGFDQRYAQPIALKVMAPNDVTILERQRELAGERPALPLNAADNLAARPLTIRVVARDRSGGRYERATVIEFTGTSDRPFVVRATE